MVTMNNMDILQFYKTKKALMAPMAGITDAAFRTVVQQHSAGLCYTEMISAKALRFHNKKTFALADVAANEARIAVQLFGKDPADFAYAIPCLEDYMGENIILFDINMGCPAPKIVNNGEGSALMCSPTIAAEIMVAAKQSTKLPVTAKIRKGFTKPNATEFAKVLQQAGADAIAMHGRLRTEYYSGEADITSIKEVVEAVEIPVVANGDIFSPEAAQNMLMQTNAAGIMVARGALGNPFLFSQIHDYFETGAYNKPSLSDIGRAMLSHAKIAANIKGEKVAMVEFRKHTAWYIKGIRGAAALRTQALAIQTLQDVYTLAHKAFGIE